MRFRMTMEDAVLIFVVESLKNCDKEHGLVMCPGKCLTSYVIIRDMQYDQDIQWLRVEYAILIIGVIINYKKVNVVTRLIKHILK